MDEVHRLARAAHTAMLAMSSTGDWHSAAGNFELIAKELGYALAKPQLHRDCIMSWNGNNVFGDRKSITEVKSLVEFKAARKRPDERDEEIEELQAQCDRQAQLLSRIAVALRGPEPPLTRWSWHDLPESALELKLGNIDPKQLSRILHEMAGAVSMCWDPRPTGEFDSAKACEFVAAAIAEIRSGVVHPEQQAPWHEMIEDTKEVFEYSSQETPQTTRDVIEYVKSWLEVYEDKAAHPPVQQYPTGCTPTDARVLREANHKLAQEVYELKESYVKGLLAATDCVEGEIECVKMQYENDLVRMKAAMEALAHAKGLIADKIEMYENK